MLNQWQVLLWLFTLCFSTVRRWCKIQTILQSVCIRYTHIFALPTLQHDTTSETQEQSLLDRPFSFANYDNGWFVAEGIWSKVSSFVHDTAQLAVPTLGCGRGKHWRERNQVIEKLARRGPRAMWNLCLVCESQQEHVAIANFKVQTLQWTDMSLGHKLYTQGGI